MATGGARLARWRWSRGWSSRFSVSGWGRGPTQSFRSIWLGKMNRSGKILLAATVLTLGPGLLMEFDVIEVSAIPGLYALLPAGVTFLAMFILDLALTKEI